MNILYIVQQSIYNSEGKWISADSNINMTMGSVDVLVDSTDWNFYILLAPIEDFHDIKKYQELFDHPRVHFVSWKRPVDAFLNRQHFDVMQFDTLMKSLPKIDIIWNNIVEISRNIKTYLYFKMPHVKLISGCYWLDTPFLESQNKIDPAIAYEPRQFDGFQCSDLFSFTCRSTKSAFLQNAEHKYPKHMIDDVMKKSTIWDFGYSETELDSFYIRDRFEKKTILFLNRMSPTNYTRHLEFIDAVNQLYEERQDFQVIFTNPSQKISWDFLQKNVKPLAMISTDVLSRKKYVELLWMSHISVHLYTNELYGGCANTEAIHCECLPIMPAVNEYITRAPKNYIGFLKADISDLKLKLKEVLDFYDNESLCTAAIRAMIDLNYKSSYEYNAPIMIRDIDLIFNNEQDREQKKYTF